MNEPAIIGTATLPRDLTPWGMFLNADPVVQGVLIGLVIASIVTWTVWLAKTIEIVRARRRLRGSLDRLTRTTSVSEAAQLFVGRSEEVAEFLAGAVAELRQSVGLPENDGIKER